MVSCLGKIGLWRIYANTPVESAKKVRWRYNAGDPWNEIEGDSYTIEEDYLLIEGQFYDIWILITYSRGSPRLHLDIFQFFYELTIIQSPNDSSLYFADAYGVPRIISGTGSSRTRITGFTVVEITNYEDTSPVDKRYTLKIFKDNQQVYQETNTKRPIVEIVPEQCTFKPENWYLARDYFNTQKEAYLFTQNYVNPFGDKCVKVLIFKKIGLGGHLIPQLLLDLCAKCDHPKIKIECEDCERCPDNTVTRLLEGGKTLHCIDAKGCVIKTIKYDKNCESYNCSC